MDMAVDNLVLSVFPGIDLFGRGFELEGYQVLRGPDLLWGQSIEDWHAPRNIFAGVIGGSPCQDFSRARRVPPRGNGVRALSHFVRIVTETGANWALLENVPGVPDVHIPGYQRQRFNLRATECGCRQSRLRCFHFFSLDGNGLVIRRRRNAAVQSHPCAMATEGTQARRRSWSDFCQLQGLPAHFDLPGLSIATKYRLVGNGVPIPMARVLAIAVRRRLVTQGTRVCICDCGRPVTGKQSHATAACRKRMERRRSDPAGDDQPGPVTA